MPGGLSPSFPDAGSCYMPVLFRSFDKRGIREAHRIARVTQEQLCPLHVPPLYPAPLDSRGFRYERRRQPLRNKGDIFNAINL